MAKRRSARKDKQDSQLPKRETEESQESKTGGASNRTIVDFLSLRMVLILALAMEAGAIFILLPDHVYNSVTQAANQAMSNRKYEKALRYYSRMNRLFGSEPDAKVSLPGRLWRGYWRRVAPYNRQIYYIRGASCLYHLERYDEAAEMLAKADPKLLKGSRYHWLGGAIPNLWVSIYYAMGQVDEATAKARDVLKGGSRSALPNFLVGRDLYNKKRYLEAALYLQHATQSEEFGEEARKMLDDCVEHVTR